jgi:hypothetical protein
MPNHIAKRVHQPYGPKNPQKRSPNFHDGVGITPDHERHFADVPSHGG